MNVPEGFIQLGDLTIGMVPLDQIVQRRVNYREMTPEAFTTLRKSIGRLGFKSFVLAARREDGKFEVLDGHHRWAAAQEQGMGALPVVLLDGTEDEADLAMLSFNVTADIKPDLYMEFLQEMNARVGSDVLAQFTALDPEFLRELDSISDLSMELADSMPGEAGEGSDRSRGMAFDVPLPRTAEIERALLACVAYYGAANYSEAVAALLLESFPAVAVAEGAR